MPSAPDGIVLPKSLGGASVQQLGVKLAVREASLGLADGATRIIAIATESARALFGMESYRGCSARLEGLAWGGEDLSADLGAESNRLPDGAYAGPYALARNLTLLARGRRRASRRSTRCSRIFATLRACAPRRSPRAATGSGPKWRSIRRRCPIINEVFTPTPEAVARARAVIAAFDAAPGAGVVALDGEMLDRPHQLRAERILARAKRGDDLESERRSQPRRTGLNPRSACRRGYRDW